MGFERLGNSQRHVVMVVIRDSMYGPVAVRSEIGHRVTGRAELFTVLHRHFQGLTNYGVWVAILVRNALSPRRQMM